MTCLHINQKAHVLVISTVFSKMKAFNCKGHRLVGV